MKKYKNVIFASLGSAFEYYDFAIYAMFASYIGSKFFHTGESTLNTVLVFIVFAGGYVVRPLGAIFFGYWGDKFSRLAMLRITIAMLFFSSLGMALLPSVESIGILSTILFVLFRSVQGMALGGEIPIAVTFVTEHFPEKKGFVASFIFAFLSLGILLTTLVFFIMHNCMNDISIASYGWRIAFFIGALMTFLIYFLRKNIDDSMSFKSEEKENKEQQSIRKIVIGITLMAAIAMLTTQMYIFLPTYVNNYLSNTKIDISGMMLIGSIIMLPCCLIGGYISDYVCRRKMMAIIVILSMIISVFFYKNLSEGKDVLFLFIEISILMGLIAPTYNILILDSFATSYKCRGLGISYNFGYMIFSAPIPALTIELINATNNLFIPFILIIITGSISLIGLLLISK